MMTIFRPLNRAFAFLAGYFWLPCPKCGQMFGGHETQGMGATVRVVEADGEHCYMVCPDCDTPELRAQNMTEMQQSFASAIRSWHADGTLPLTLNPGEERILGGQQANTRT